MKSLWLKSLVLTGALALPSHAIVGLGVHWAPAFGPEIKASNGPVMPDGTNPAYANRILLNTGSASGLQGLGVKLWLDFIPVVDLEATLNAQFGYYDMTLIVDTASTPGGAQYDTTRINPKYGIPFTQDKPFYARVSGDLAVLYPFFQIPMLKVYAGGGLSYIVATPVLNSSFTRKALENAEAEGNGFNPETDDPSEIQDVVIDALKDDSNYGKGIGFFAQVGAKVKPPIIPLAVYANGKYGFGGPSVSGVSSGGLTIELGGAIAF